MGLWDFIKKIFRELFTTLALLIWTKITEAFRPKRKPSAIPSQRPPPTRPELEYIRPPPGPGYSYKPPGQGPFHRFRDHVKNGYRNLKSRYQNYGPTHTVIYPEEYTRGYFGENAVYRGQMNNLYRNENFTYGRRRRY